MKRYKNIWEKFYTIENAITAIELGTQHKRMARVVRRKLGYSKAEIQAYPTLLYSLDPKKVRAVAEQILGTISRDWKPQPCRHITKRSQTTGKIREIDCPNLQDHIVHWMLILAIKPAIMRGMYKYSCGSISGRGIDYARKTLEKWVQQKDSVYFVKLDIKKFYHNIDHDILKALFRRILKDKRILTVINAVIDSLPKGLAIGNYTSQWFANFYLQTLDHFILQKNYKMRRGKRVNYVKHYLRYMDDMILIGSSKRDLEKTVKSVSEFALQNLNVVVKPTWEIKKFADYKLDAIGYRFSKESTTVRKVIFLHAKRLAKRIYKMKQKKGFIIPRNAQAMESLLGWFSHSDSKYFRSVYIEPYINEKEILEVISNESRKHSITAITNND